MCSLDGRSGTNTGAIPGRVKRASVEGAFFISRPSTSKFEPQQVTAPFQQENALPRRGQLIRQRAPARAGADNDDVVTGLCGHGIPPWCGMQSEKEAGSYKDA